MKLKKLLSMAAIGMAVTLAPLTVCAEEPVAVFQESTNAELDNILLTVKALFDNGDYAGMCDIDTSDVVMNYAKQIASSGLDRYVCDIDGNTKAMFYVDDNGYYWYYFGEMSNGLRNGIGTTVMLIAKEGEPVSGCDVFTGIYANDFPAGEGMLSHIEFEWDSFTMQGNFQGANLNGMYTVNVTAEGDTSNMVLTYVNGHLQYFNDVPVISDNTGTVSYYIEDGKTFIKVNWDNVEEPALIEVGDAGNGRELGAMGVFCHKDFKVSVFWQDSVTDIVYGVFKGNSNVASPAAVVTPEVPAVTQQTTYVVERDDNLSKIAKKVYGDEKGWRDIYKANSDVVKDDYVIYANQVLIIPAR